MTLVRLFKQALFKQGIRPFLIILQLTIGFTALCIGLGLVEGTESLLTIVSHEIPVDTIGFTTPQVSQSVTTLQLQTMYKSLQIDPQVKQIGTLLTIQTQIPELQNNPYLKNRGASRGTETYMSGSVAIGFADRSYLNMHSFTVSSGRSLTVQDVYELPTDQIPVLIGSELAKTIPLGSILSGGVFDSKKETIAPKQLLVVGVLNQPFRIWQGGDCLECAFTENDAMIIAPIQPELDVGEYLKTRLSSDLQIRLQDGVDATLFRRQLEQKMSDIGLTGHTRTIQEDIEYFRKEHHQQILFSLSFAGLLLFLSSFGLLGVILVSIVRRQQEFGIRFALGATPRSFAWLVAGEVFVLTFLSGLLGVLITMLISSSEPESLPIQVGVSTCLYTLCVILLIGLIGSLVPMIRIVRMEPISLIRGEGSYGVD